VSVTNRLNLSGIIVKFNRRDLWLVLTVIELQEALWLVLTIMRADHDFWLVLTFIWIKTALWLFLTIMRA
jgi:hypothetical protein